MRDLAVGRLTRGAVTSPYGGNSLKVRRKMAKNTREKQRRSELNDKVCVICDILVRSGCLMRARWFVCVRVCLRAKRVCSRLGVIRSSPARVADSLCSLCFSGSSTCCASCCT